MATAAAVEKVTVVQDAVKAITAVTAELPKVVQATEELAESVLATVDKAYGRIETIRRDEVTSNTKVFNARQDLKLTARQALSYVDQVKDLFQFGRDGQRWSAITDGLMQTKTHHKRKRNWRRLWLKRTDTYTVIATPDPHHLREFIDELKRILVRVEEFYQRLEEAIDKATATTINAAEECRHRAAQAKREADKTKLAGGVGTGILAVAGGALASLLGGPAAGLAVGGGITAGGAGVTMHISHGYKELEEAFNEQKNTLDSLAKKGSEMKENTLELHCAMEGLSMAVDDIEYSLQKSSSLQSVCHHLRLLRAKFEETSQVPTECHSKIESCLSKLNS